MNQRLITFAACLLLLIAAAPLAHAQSDSASPNRVGFVIQVDTSDRPAPDQINIVEHTLRQIHHKLENARSIQLIEQDRLVSAQARLGITLNIESSSRDMQLVANLLELDRLVIVKITVSQRYVVSVAARVFDNDTDRAPIAAVRASGAELGNVLGRVISSLLDVLFPALSKS